MLGDFTIGPNRHHSTLTFKASPNYERPADADTNNVYKVTVQAADSFPQPR